MKRLFDFFFSLIAVLLLSPIMVFIYISVRISMGKPVLFTQERIGLGEAKLKIYKFRTMSNDKDCSGKLLPNSERVTALGRLLRKSSLDELPSLFNVISGDMSLVGPRPLLVSYLPYYKREHRVRHSVKPGITGLAQVNGRNATTWQKRLDFDAEYVKNRSLLLDIKILFLTVYKVIKSEGVEGQSDLSIIPLSKDISYLGEEHD
ncbi:sugar transferase [Vibrio breoganii]|uniref:sugar transferase n=1 Tax=Vibrio breoganii TaxID=553239 RepID=UPI000C832FE1|nr:sugar transferase [Vibrio breoganii]PMG94746.1 hypothetical protein BCU80_06115 [Vibrio breoganii]